MPDYGHPGKFAAAVDRAIAADNKRPRPPLPPLCGIDGCPLPAGHLERAGTPHLPPIVTPEEDHTAMPAENQRTVSVERYGNEQRTTPEHDGLVSFRQQHSRIATANALLGHHLGQRQAIELPGVRTGEWIYRATTYAVDPWDVLAYVGDLTGDEAVRASEEFLTRTAEAWADAARPFIFEPRT